MSIDKKNCFFLAHRDGRARRNVRILAAVQRANSFNIICIKISPPLLPFFPFTSYSFSPFLCPLSLSSFHFLWDTSNAATRLHTLYMMMSLPPPQPPSKHLHRNILLIPYPAPLPGFQLNTRKKATEFFFACDLFHGQNNTTRKSQRGS